MKFKSVLLTVLLTSLFILSGCKCPCSKKSCPMPQNVAATDLGADSTVQ